jgi:hypothetical protein
MTTENYVKRGKELAAHFAENPRFNGVEVWCNSPMEQNDKDAIEELGQANALEWEKNYVCIEIGWYHHSMDHMNDDNEYVSVEFDTRRFEKDLLAFIQEFFGDDALLDRAVHNSGDFEIRRQGTKFPSYAN